VLTSVLSDEKGLKQLIGELYELTTPVSFGSVGQVPNQKDPLSGIVANKEMAITLFNSVIQNMLTEFIVAIDDVEEEPAPGETAAKDPLHGLTSFKLNLYLDSDLSLRKRTFELTKNAKDSDIKGFKTMTITGSEERWSMNSKVKAQLIDGKNGFRYNDESKPKELLAVFDEESLAYSLLKDDLQVNREVIRLPISTDNTPDGIHPYIRDGVTLVPVRFVLESFGADVKWNGEKQEVTIAVPSTTIRLTIGSDTAYVNDQAKKLDVPAELNNDVSYVPVRFVAETLGAEVGWDNATRSVIIIREDG